jgi:thioredoxin reductase (NADPH)
VPETITIIGSGPAAWTAALYAARAGLAPLVFEGAATEENMRRGTLPLGQLNLASAVENFPSWLFVAPLLLEQFSRSAFAAERYASLEGLYRGKGSSGKRAVFGPEIIEYMRQQALNFGTRVVGDDIVAVDLKRHPFRLTATDGATVETQTLVVATGRAWLPSLGGIPGEQEFRFNGISLGPASDGTLPRFRHRPVVAVGGGDCALEDAAYLARFAARVYLVHPEQKLRLRWLARESSDRLRADPKIEMRLGWQITEVLGNEDAGVTAVRLRNGQSGVMEEIICSGVFLASDFSRPNTTFLEGQVELDEQGYVQLKEPSRTCTSVEGVFAAGDVADDYYRQAITAARTGCMAALDAERWLASQGLRPG